MQTLHTDTLKKQKDDVFNIHKTYEDVEWKNKMQKVNADIFKKTDLRKDMEPELEPEFEDIGDEEITNDDIDIDYDPRKIDLDNIDLDDDQAYA